MFTSAVSHTRDGLLQPASRADCDEHVRALVDAGQQDEALQLCES